MFQSPAIQRITVCEEQVKDVFYILFTYIAGILMLYLTSLYKQ